MSCLPIAYTKMNWVSLPNVIKSFTGQHCLFVHGSIKSLKAQDDIACFLLIAGSSTVSRFVHFGGWSNWLILLLWSVHVDGALSWALYVILIPWIYLFFFDCFHQQQEKVISVRGVRVLFSALCRVFVFGSESLFVYPASLPTLVSFAAGICESCSQRYAVGNNLMRTWSCSRIRKR